MGKAEWLEEKFIGGEKKEDKRKSKWEGWAAKKGSPMVNGDETKHSPVLFSEN